MSTEWLIKYYMETFRSYPHLTSRDLRKLIDEHHNYKASVSMSRRVKVGALHLS